MLVSMKAADNISGSGEPAQDWNTGATDWNGGASGFKDSTNGAAAMDFGSGDANGFGGADGPQGDNNCRNCGQGKLLASQRSHS